MDQYSQRFLEQDKRMKEVLNNAEYAVYSACNECARNRIEQAETNSMIDLSGDDQDESPLKMLIGKVIDVIAKKDEKPSFSISTDVK